MLTQKQFLQIEKWIDVDPVTVALKSENADLAQAVAALQKAKTKTPAYYKARCEMSTVMVEQATSEIVAMSREFVGNQVAVDLTCGMGVDSVAMAKCFKKVIAIEIDQKKVEITKANFKRLGVDNVDIICCSAEKFLEKFKGNADLIFCDPSRRSENGKRLYSLQDCAPNVIDLMEQMKEKANQIMVKLSPLFDVDELFKLFPNANVEVISLNGECKEVVLKIEKNQQGQENKKRVLSNCVIKGDKSWRFKFYQNDRKNVELKKYIKLEKPKFIYQPDVAFYKSRTVDSYMKQKFDGVKYHFDNYIFAEDELEDFVGRKWKIKEMLPYQPKKLKLILKKNNITKATIIHRNFIHSTELICKQLAIKEGGLTELLFTRFDGKNVVVFV